MANTGTVSIEYPDELRVSLKYKKDEFADEIKKISLIKLYELGKISSGMAAKVLDISPAKDLPELRFQKTEDKKQMTDIG